jgi:site-specific DNA-methyltransferase (adenine-specific)
MSKATFNLKARNPDVLSCIANLSNDEVFTPPEFVNEMLDVLESAWANSNQGQIIWEDETVTFLDPATKTGVYLREIVSRLVVGLERKIPDLKQRVDHILTKQVFGIAITELTALLARRSVYCSKWADGEHSITKQFKDPNGNIWFGHPEHTWAGDRCSYCGAKKLQLDRGSKREAHAYAFIHSLDIKKWIQKEFGDNMHFDVIIGNPPYQLKDDGAAASARPIYQLFIKQALALDPRFVSMVVPSRWFSGGKGLDEFRSQMLGDKRLRSIVDFIVDKDAFPKINLNGGVNYFLWERDNPGECEITTIAPGGKRGLSESRDLGEFDVFIRRNEAVSILRKVLAMGDPSFKTRISARKPFGLPTNFHGAGSPSASKPIKLHGSGKVSWVGEQELLTNREWTGRWKVLVAAATDGNENYPLPIWDQIGPFVAGPGEACSETYLVAYVAESEEEARNVVAYMRTRFFRFMVSLRKVAQHNKIENFGFVPFLPMDKVREDEELFKRYKLTVDEVEFIKASIREMNFDNV